MDADGEEENGDESKVDDGVDHDGDSAGLEIAELHESALPRELEKQPRRQQDEQNDRYEHRSPVRHR